MRVKLNVLGRIITDPCSTPEELNKVNASIRRKMNGKIIEIPCIPSKQMAINLCDFLDVYEFDENEHNYINECCDYFEITAIYIKPTHLEIVLKQID